MAPRRPKAKPAAKPMRGQRSQSPKAKSSATSGRGAQAQHVKGQQRQERSCRDGAQDRPRRQAQQRAYGKLQLKMGEDVSILEGRHAFEEAMQTGAAIEALYISDAFGIDDPIVALANQARKDGVKVHTVDSSRLDAYSSHGAHQGVIAQLKPYRYASLRELIDAAAGKENALIIATDHVTDAGNFGAIARSAEVVGACGMLIPNKRNARVNTAAYKTSAGAVMHLPIAMEANLARSLSALKDEGFWIVGASEHAQDVIWDAPLSGRVCLVMGNEAEGLSRLTLEACDVLVKLPQTGKVESLNVAQATCAIAYEWARQSRQA